MFQEQYITHNLNGEMMRWQWWGANPTWIPDGIPDPTRSDLEVHFLRTSDILASHIVNWKILSKQMSSRLYCNRCISTENRNNLNRCFYLRHIFFLQFLLKIWISFTFIDVFLVNISSSAICNKLCAKELLRIHPNRYQNVFIFYLEHLRVQHYYRTS